MNGVQVNTGIPVLLSAFMAYGDFLNVIMQAVLVAASTCVWLPFFKILDNQALQGRGR